MFVDKVKIFIKAGSGGDGCVSFHREKYVPNGGPDGGDGGNGGSILFRANDEMRTLLDFRYKRKFAAQNGEPGRKKNMRGKNGENLVIDVPPGTLIRDAETGKIAADIRSGERVLLKGGQGGKGNARFKTATRQAPRFSTPGAVCTGHWVILELKSIADVGLIGFPNVGKSTFLSCATAAKPKIANYHFTTLAPNLGVAEVNGFSFILADIPGLIEGAHEGAGLGHDFLRHIERTRMLLHVVDASGSEAREPVEDYKKIREELKLYSPELVKKQEIVAANKTDIGGEENVQRLRETLGEKGVPVYAISCATGAGIRELLNAVAAAVKELPLPEPICEEGAIEEWELEEELTFAVERDEQGRFLVTGNAVDTIFKRINPEDEQSMRHFQKLLIDFGIIRELRAAGAKDGDTVQLNDVEFDFYE